MHTIARDTMVDGRYRALKRLGSGGMADVWCVEDEVLGRRVALKLLGARFAEDDEFRERFRREARAAAGLTHPNIVGIFDRSEWDGTPYIAMELVDGRTLKDVVREHGPLDITTAINVMEQILRALGYAHKRGIVHRDVKPQNVLIDNDGQAKVADFGIAHAGPSDMTETGALVGTVQYVSPEQAQGLPVDRRSDLYSAGVVLYELLTGRIPFDAEVPVSVALMHISEHPVPPSQLRPGIPPALEAVTMRALEKDPDRRYQSAEEFVAALEAARRAPSQRIVVDATPGEPWVEEEEAGSRWWIWLVALAVIAVLGFAAYLLVGAGQKVDVPKVTGDTASDATATMHRHDLNVAFKSVTSDDAPRDEVIAQDPAAGARVKKNSTVTLTISSGRGEAPVPDVAGQSQSDAEAALRAAGFQVQTKDAFSDSVASGQVISQAPAAGSALTRGRTVTLTISRGAEGVAVPKVVGLQSNAAQTQLKAAGLKPKVVEQETSQPAGTVMKQDPVTGTRVDKGATVTLTVAKPRPLVPDVSGQSVQDATNQLEAAGFKVKVSPSSAAASATVNSQSPAAGSRRSSGATITLRVASATPTPTSTPSPTPTPTETPTPTDTPTPTATP